MEIKKHLSLLECTTKRQIASLLSQAFRDLAFSNSLLTDGAVSDSQNKCIRLDVFLPYISSLSFPQKNKKQKKPDAGYH